MNNSYIYIHISCKCDTNRAGHFTLDAHASRPVACLLVCGDCLLNGFRITSYAASFNTDYSNSYRLTDSRIPTSIGNLESWWRHQMRPYSALLAICAGNSPVPVNSPHNGQWRRALIFSLICVWINDWVNNREAGDLRRHRGHYDVNVMCRWFIVYKLYMSPWFLLYKNRQTHSSSWLF